MIIERYLGKSHVPGIHLHHSQLFQMLSSLPDLECFCVDCLDSHANLNTQGILESHLLMHSVSQAHRFIPFSQSFSDIPDFFISITTRSVNGFLFTLSRQRLRIKAPPTAIFVFMIEIRDSRTPVVFSKRESPLCSHALC
jgi:hypothetical protein